MAPLALLALAAIGVGLPALYSRALLSERAAEARADAQRLALRYGLLAARDEGLWAYAYGALALEARPLTASGALVRLDTPRRPAAFVALPEGAAAPPPPGAPLAYGGAPVLARGEEVGRVGVWRPAEDLGALQRRLWLLAAVVALATAGGTLVLPTRAARRADAEIRALWDELSALNATLEARVEERTRQLARLSNRLMRAQEEERARVSRDLHDDLGQALTGLRLQLTALLRAPGAPPPLAPLIAGVDDSIARVRALAHDLRPPELDALGLSHALRRHLEGRAAAAGLALSLLDELEGAGESPLTAAESDAVFRVAQEALTNVLRHAHAARVDVRLWRDAAGWLCLRVVDDGDGRGGGAAGDGRGGGAAGDGRGLGLLGAAERARELGGHLSALPRAPSHPLGGFSLLLRLPPPS
ncbi:MAG: hypothetical protein FJ138_18270 [Deltaproteobacteria bacterium]|nr:hypothetical protein [Deltaproteobacteria bacterium]